jgi:hypothetical protein
MSDENPIIPRSAEQANYIPFPGELLTAELAVDAFTGRLFLKLEDGTVRQINGMTQLLATDNAAFEAAVDARVNSLFQ